MSVVVPQNPKDDAYLVGQTGLSSWQGPWFDASLCHELGFTVAWTAVAATNGTLYIEGTDDPDKGALNVVPLTISTSHGTWPTVAAIAGNAMVRVSNPPHFIRLGYTRIAGGGAAQFKAFCHGRSL